MIQVKRYNKYKIEGDPRVWVLVAFSQLHLCGLVSLLCIHGALTFIQSNSTTRKVNESVVASSFCGTFFCFFLPTIILKWENSGTVCEWYSSSSCSSSFLLLQYKFTTKSHLIFVLKWQFVRLPSQFLYNCMIPELQQIALCCTTASATAYALNALGLYDNFSWHWFGFLVL